MVIGRAFAAGAGAALVSGTAAAGGVSLSVIDQVVLLGLAVVLPLVIGNLPWWWAASVAATAVAFLLPRGPAAIAAVPVVVACGAVVAARLRAAGAPFWWDLRVAAEVLAISYGLVAAMALLASR